MTFGYTSTDPVLRDFDLTVAAGETVALVGSSGSGKSTVALMLPRFYDVHAGRITIDGVDVRDVRLDSLRRNIGVVFEDSFLFSDTITANIGFGQPDATREEIETAARAAEAHEFILRLPNGYDTVVGEQGLTLSGGQRQRVALARALLSDPKILLLDDATSSVDSRVEEEIHATLRRIAQHAHDDPHRAPPLVAVVGRPHRRGRPRARCSTPARTTSSGRAARSTACCSPGPGGDAEGLEANEAEVRRRAGQRRSRRRRGAASTTRRSAARRSPSAPAPPSPTAAVRVAGGGGGGGGMGAGGLGRRARAHAGVARAGRRARPRDRRPAHRRRRREPAVVPTSSSCASSGGTAAGC